MKNQKRRLQKRDVQEDLKGSFEYRLLAGLNGRIRPFATIIGDPRPDALLPRSSKSIERISRFLWTLKGATQPDDGIGIPLGKPDQEQSLKRANEYLKSYLQFPSIVVDPFSGELSTQAVFCAGDEWENLAIDDILWLLKQGQLFRLCTCPCCEKWFYALREGQRFCSMACRQKEHSQSKEFKENRKEYMQRYRKSGDINRAKSRV